MHDGNIYNYEIQIIQTKTPSARSPKECQISVILADMRSLLNSKETTVDCVLSGNPLR
jgi:hypothetical protein